MLLFATKTAVKTIPKTILEPTLFSKSVTFGNGHKVEAVYEDSLAAGSSIGTVVGFHGSPGSHNDFKYIRDTLAQHGIRFIGLNYPGFSNVKGYIGQNFGNEDRQMYTNTLLEKLNITGRTVFMGHSRGCENALQTAVENNAHGVILINPIGFRPLRNIPTPPTIRKLVEFYNFLPKFVADSLFYVVYKSLGFRIKNGEECINALKTMIGVMLDEQIPLIEKINNSKTKVLFLYGGSDKLIRSEAMIEVLKNYRDLVNFNFEDEPDIGKVSRSLWESGKGASVFIRKDNHFQNKFRADLIARSIQTILSS